MLRYLGLTAFGLFLLTSPAAAVVPEIEPNDSAYDAQSFTFGETIEASLHNSGDLDWFVFYATAGMQIRIYLLHEMTPAASNFILELWAGGAPGFITSSDTPPSGGTETETIEYTVSQSKYYYIFTYSNSYLGYSSYTIETTWLNQPEPTPRPTPTLKPIFSYNEPIAATALNSDFEDSFPCLTADLLEVFFRSDRSGDQDVWSATREFLSAPWNSPFAVTELNSSSWDGPSAVSADGLEIFIASGRSVSTNTNRVYRSTRPDRSSAWSAPVEVPELNPPQVADHLAYPHCLSEDGLRMYQSRRSGADWDAFVSDRASVGAVFSGPTPVPGVNTGSADSGPALSGDELTILFTRDTGMENVFGARRHDVSGSFVVQGEMTELNQSGSETGMGYVSADLGWVWLHSDRPGSPNSLDIYVSNNFTPTPTPWWKTGVPAKYWR
jgi:hypothetical protein